MALEREPLTPERIALFRRLFRGLPNVYGTYDPVTRRARQVKAPVTDQVIAAHLTGRQPYGVYLLTGKTTRALAVDFDVPDIAPAVRFADLAYGCRLPAYIERSKSKGHHVWWFFPDAGVPARKARLLARYILGQMKLTDTEIFPKQDQLAPNVVYGNYIYAPLFGRSVIRERTVFLDRDNAGRPYPEQLAFLATIEPIPETRLDHVLRQVGLWGKAHQLTPSGQPANPRPAAGPSAYPAYGLPPCARRILAAGVDRNQRVCCFRLAVNLKRVGLPCDLALAALLNWARKNKPLNGKRVITPAEIKAQTQAAYQGRYTALGCEDPAIAPFCRPECRLYQKRHAPGYGSQSHAPI